MPAARFFSWATRIFAYGGVMQQRLLEDRQEVVREVLPQPVGAQQESKSVAQLMVNNPGLFEVARSGG